jgi:hypothetical protein
MHFQSLEIKRTASYETPANTIVGVVSLSGESGSQTIRLSTSTIGQIMSLILSETKRTAAQNAGLVEGALKNAVAERQVLEMAGHLPE